MVLLCSLVFPHTACEAIVGGLEAFVSNSSTLDAKIENLLEVEVCERLPTAQQALCNATVSSELPTLMAKLAQLALDPTRDCTALHLCTSNGPLCSLCQAAAAFIDSKVRRALSRKGEKGKEDERKGRREGYGLWAMGAHFALICLSKDRLGMFFVFLSWFFFGGGKRRSD